MANRKDRFARFCLFLGIAGIVVSFLIFRPSDIRNTLITRKQAISKALDALRFTYPIDSKFEKPRLVENKIYDALRSYFPSDSVSELAEKFDISPFSWKIVWHDGFTGELLVDAVNARITRFQAIPNEEKQLSGTKTITVKHRNSKTLVSRFLEAIGETEQGFESVGVLVNESKEATESTFIWEKPISADSEICLRRLISIVSGRISLYKLEIGFCTNGLTYIRAADSIGVSAVSSSEESFSAFFTVVFVILLLFLVALTGEVREIKNFRIFTKYGFLVVASTFMAALFGAEIRNFSDIFGIDIPYLLFRIAAQTVMAVAALWAGQKAGFLVEFAQDHDKSLLSKFTSPNAIKGYVAGFGLLGLSIFATAVYSRLNLGVGESFYVTKLANAFSPVIFPLFMALSVALSEEAMFRFFTMNSLFKLMRKVWVAVVLSALIWAVFHTFGRLTPQTFLFFLDGVILALTLYYYGFFAAVIAHFALDAALMAIILAYLRNPFALLLIFAALSPLFLSRLTRTKKPEFLIADDASSET